MLLQFVGISGSHDPSSPLWENIMKNYLDLKVQSLPARQSPRSAFSWGMFSEDKQTKTIRMAKAAMETISRAASLTCFFVCLFVVVWGNVNSREVNRHDLIVIVYISSWSNIRSRAYRTERTYVNPEPENNKQIKICFSWTLLLSRNPRNKVLILFRMKWKLKWLNKVNEDNWTKT